MHTAESETKTTVWMVVLEVAVTGETRRLRERLHGGIDEMACRKAEVYSTTAHPHAGSAVMTCGGGGAAVVVWGCGGDPWG